ncbi:MAG: primosomal protein N' family DNA-binding protein, partial [Anaerolineales bacterium]
MAEYVEIAVNVPQVEGVFHYHLPEEFEGVVSTGHLVEVPFGRQHVQGVVLRRVDQPEVPGTKAVAELLDQKPVLTAEQIELARYIAESTLSSLAAAINMMLPPGLGQQADSLYAVQRGKSASSLKALTPLQIRLMKLLEERGALRGRQIDQAIPRVNWRAAARGLVRRGLISVQPVLPTPSVRPKIVCIVRLAADPDTVKEQIQHLGRAGSKTLERRQAVMRFLLA